MSGFFNVISKIEHALVAILAVSALLLAVWEMFMRYYFAGYLPDWTAEIVVYLITASVMLSGGRLVAESRHVSADMFLTRFSAGQQRVFQILFCLIGLFVTAIFVERGIGITEFAYRLDERSDSSLQFPVFIYYAFVPIAFSMMFLHYLARLARYIYAFDAKTMTHMEIDLENAD
jgi:C4-dicarboxylate transporter, DctQ subunit